MDTTKTNKKSKFGVFQMVLVAMFAAIGAICAWISIPMPSGVPITLQTFGMALIGYTLGYKYGTLSTVIYVSLGTVGVPVFSEFKGGIGHIASVGGGFIYGFIFLTLLCGLMRLSVFESKGKIFKTVFAVIFGILGLIVCHTLGIVQFMLLTSRGFIESALMVSIPYLVKDIISVVAAYFVSLAAITLIKKAGRRSF